MRSTLHPRRLAAHLVVLALCARIMVPTGYMPGDTGDGWHLQLCPDGLSAAAASLLLGEHHHHASHESEGPESPCELGGFASASETSNPMELEATYDSARAGRTSLPGAKSSQPANTHRVRAPPKT